MLSQSDFYLIVYNKFYNVEFRSSSKLLIIFRDFGLLEVEAAVG